MFRHFFLFELRYQLKGWMVRIFLFVIGAMILGATASDSVRVGGSIGNTNRNAPYVVQNFYAIASILTLLMTTAFANSASIRDFQHNTNQILFSLPVSRWGFILGRFCGSTLVAMLPALGVSAGVVLARYMPWVDAERFGPAHLEAHLNGLLCFAAPNTIFIACILFPVGMYFRNTTVSFLAALGLLVASSVANAFTSDLKNEVLAALLDPYGVDAFNYMTKYWTVAERNSLSLPLSGVLLTNRLIWLAVGALVLFGLAGRISLGERRSLLRWRMRPGLTKAPEIGAKPARASWAGNAGWAQFAGAFRLEFRSLTKTPAFIVILAAALLNSTASLVFSFREMYGNKTFPVTYAVTEVIQGTLYLFLLAIITFFAGQLIWRERDDRVDEIQDSLPVRDWLLYAAKLAALATTVAAILAAAVLDGIAIQAFSGYTRFQIPVYLGQIFLRDYTSLLCLCIAALFLHIVSPNKYVGYFAFVSFLLLDAFGWRAVNVTSRLVDFASRPSMPYSDFYGFRPGLESWLWFTGYWLALSSLMAVASILLFRRGKDVRWAHRWRVASQRLNGGTRIAASLLSLGVLGSAGWLYYNTKVLNELISPDEATLRRVDYERRYKWIEKVPQPRITKVKYWIDLTPEQRAVVFRGEQEIVNTNADPVTKLYLNYAPDYATEVEIPGGAVEKRDERLRFLTYRFSQPMAPGERRRMKFKVSSDGRELANGVKRWELVQNGTFFNNDLAPSIGYDDGRELSDRNDRRKHKLPEKDRMPALERNCSANCMNNYLNSSSDWVDVETVISTTPGQIAVAPGTLLREWTGNGRRYFHYRMDHASLNFYSFISADYRVRRERWNGVSVEVYHHPEHTWNVSRMVDSIRKTLEYCTTNFGPYAHRQARIIEFPRVASFAQAFPGTMPYSEGIGFIADLRDKESIDHVFYVVAHEMGHQWWAHQVIGANMQGATLLSESLAQYTALMVMEREYGRDRMRKFLEYEMDSYLGARGREPLKERPLIRVESSQGYIHYNKGSLALYYLKEMIGEQAVNGALREMVEKFGYAAPPYPTSHELVERLRARTPPEYQYLIRDLFEEITLFSNRTLEATAKKRPDGQYEVTIQAESRKFKADEMGNEREVAVRDWIEFGAFAKPEKGAKFGRTLYRERVLLTQRSPSRTFVVKEPPDKAGIDPFHLLVDRIKDDNLKSVDLR